MNEDKKKEIEDILVNAGNIKDLTLRRQIIKIALSCFITIISLEKK